MRASLRRAASIPLILASTLVSFPASAEPRLVTDLTPGQNSSAIKFLGALGDSVVFLNAVDDGTTHLWISDGTASGTRKLPWISNVTVTGTALTVGTRLYFGFQGTPDAASGVWRTDGTDVGTKRAASTNYPLELAASASHVIVYDGLAVPKKWLTSIHTTTGDITKLDAYSGSNPLGPFASLGGKVYFASVGKNGQESFGEELSRTDGTESGTGTVKVLDQDEAVTDQIVASGSRLFFIRRAEEQEQLWTSDGTSAGTRKLATFPNTFGFGTRVIDHLEAAAGGAVLFRNRSSKDSSEREELWRSDGTTAGTFSLGHCIESSFDALGVLGRAGSLTFFRGHDDSAGAEVWQTDGTIAGTHVFADLLAGAEGASPSDGVSGTGSTFFFGGPQGASRQWLRSNGTPAGTQPLFASEPKGFPALSGTNHSGSSPGGGLVAGNKFFFLFNDEASGLELWVDDIPSGSSGVGSKADGDSGTNEGGVGARPETASPSSTSVRENGCSLGRSARSECFALVLAGLAALVAARRRASAPVDRSSPR